MTLLGLSARNVFRNKFRTSLTIAGVAVAVLAFLLLRTVLSAWTAGADYAAKDRVVTRHKVTFVLPLPRRYVDDVRGVAGIKQVTWANWFGGKEPNHEKEFFGVLAVDGKTFFDVYDDCAVTPDVKARWDGDRTGAILGDVLLRKLGLKVGDKVTLRGDIYPGDWQFTVDGVYKATSRAVDRSQFLFHWEYLNEAAPARARDKVGWLTSRVTDPSRTAEVVKSIDLLFDTRDTQTLSQDEHSFSASFLASFSAVLKAIDIVSLVILAIMALILGNTIAMGVRERTSEYGVLRAIGFLPRHVAQFVLGEALVVGLLGGLAGLAISYPFIEQLFGRWLEENMGSFFPFFRIDTSTAVAGVLLAVGLGGLAAIVPAWRAYKLDIIQSLRRVG